LLLHDLVKRKHRERIIIRCRHVQNCTPTICKST